MILTASKPVNIRLGKPSVNAPNPSFLVPGDKIFVKSKVIGDRINGNPAWIMTDANEFISIEGFEALEEIKSIPFFSHVENAPKLFNALDISELWNISMGEGINIGIIDNGVASHPSLKSKVIELNGTIIEDLAGHGTTMACIIGALDEANGKIGVSPMIQNIFSYRLNVDELQPGVLMAALDKMLEAKVNVLNLSFSCNTFTFFKPRPDAVKLQEKINELVNSGCIIVAATGNDHQRNQDFYPAKYDNVISVAGIDNEGNLDMNSNLWNGVSISISSDHYYNDDQFKNSNGTSGATAIISGCLSCVYNSLKTHDKTKAISSLLSKLPPAAIQFDGKQISIPTFNIKKFIQLLKL